jgi:hypothetical protein
MEGDGIFSYIIFKKLYSLQETQQMDDYNHLMGFGRMKVVQLQLLLGKQNFSLKFLYIVNFRRLETIPVMLKNFKNLLLSVKIISLTTRYSNKI